MPAVPSRPVARAAVALALALLVAGCSGDSDEVVSTTTVGETTTTTAAPEATTTTTAVPVPTGPVAPLTGEPVDEAITTPALIVKLDNHPESRPQTGLDEADIVIELQAEGVTRFAAVFHSRQPAPVGPVRSSRTADFDLVRGFNTPLYASSGGNDAVVGQLRSLPIIDVTVNSRQVYFRDGSRRAPHNLYVNSPDLFAFAPDDAEPPLPWFLYRAEGDSLGSAARPVTTPVAVSFRGGQQITFTWDETQGGWLRTQDGVPHVTSLGDQLAPENVVIMVATYGTSNADASSPELNSVGGGDAFVLTDGQLITGTWERETAESVPTLVDDNGDPIKLTPGQTWLLYPEAGNVRVS